LIVGTLSGLSGLVVGKEALPTQEAEMSRKVKLLSAGLALGVITGAGAGASMAGGGTVSGRAAAMTPIESFTASAVVGSARGSVTSVWRGGGHPVSVAVSLHGLEPGTDYRVVASLRPCSRPHVPRQRAFVVPFTTRAAADDALKAGSVAAVRPPFRAKSVRVLKADDTEVGCGRQLWVFATQNGNLRLVS
jgi:hypothetical protein